MEKKKSDAEESIKKPVVKSFKIKKSEWFMKQYFMMFYHNLAIRSEKGGYKMLRKIKKKKLIVFPHDGCSFFNPDD